MSQKTIKFFHLIICIILGAYIFSLSNFSFGANVFNVICNKLLVTINDSASKNYTEPVKCQDQTKNSDIKTGPILFLDQQNRYVTSFHALAAGLGNQIWRFASQYGIGRKTGRKIYIDGRDTDQMKYMLELSEAFPNLHENLHIKFPMNYQIHNASGYYSVDCCKFDDPMKISNVSQQYLIVGGNYLNSYKYFHTYRQEIRKLLECGPLIMPNVQAVANQWFKDDRSHFLCVHIRRSDFIGSIFLESKIDFVQPALEFAYKYLERKGHKNISILFIGDDHTFIRKHISFHKINITNFYIPITRKRTVDFCLGVHYCDSMLITASSSTFAWWISYLLSENTTVFYNSQITRYGNFSKDLYDYDTFLEEWIKITVKNGVAFREDLWTKERLNISKSQ